MALSSSAECPCQFPTSPMTRTGSLERYESVGLPGYFLSVKIGVVFKRSSRLHNVDSAGPLTKGELRSPDSRIQRAGQINVGRLLPLTVVRIVARPNEIPRF